MKITSVITVLLIVSVCLNVVFLASYISTERERESLPSGLQHAQESEIIPNPVVVTPNLHAPVDPSDIERVASLQAPAVSQMVRNMNPGGYPAWDVEQKGSLMNISAEIKPGKGGVLVHTTPLMGVVFQDAANIAVLVAANRTGIDLSKSDVIFSIESPEQISEVDGPSAGALMTLLAVSALENHAINESLTLSGTINDNGHIGRVSGLVEKATAAKESGKTLFLLPQDNQFLTISSLETSRYGMYTYAHRVNRQVSTKEFIEKNVGISIRYVNTIDDVLSTSLRSS